MPLYSGRNELNNATNIWYENFSFKFRSFRLITWTTLQGGLCCATVAQPFPGYGKCFKGSKDHKESKFSSLPPWLDDMGSLFCACATMTATSSGLGSFTGMQQNVEVV